MANIYRLIALCLLMVTSSLYAADYTVLKSTGPPVCNVADPPPCPSNLTQAPFGCSIATHINADTCEKGWQITYQGQLGAFNSQTLGFFVKGVPTCPDSSAEFSGKCYCQDGFKPSPDSLQCAPDANAAKCKGLSGGVDNSYTRSYGTGSSSSICAGIGGGSGCTVDIKWDLTYSVNGSKFNSGIGSYGGKTCGSTTFDNAALAAAYNPPASPPAIPAAGDVGSPAPNPCAPGTFPGSVNNVAVCVPPSGTAPVSASTSTTTTAPTSAASAPGSAGGTTSNSTTTCTGSSCSTTTTTIVTGGSGSTPLTTTTTTDQPKDDFCTKNPKSSLCITSTYGTGTCGSSAPACSGDAVQCGIALQGWQTQCALSPSPGQESLAYDAAKTLTGNQTLNLPGNANVNISSASFDQTEFLGGPGGAQDLVVTVSGRVITLPISQVNPWLSRLGFILQAVTFLVCLKIVTREG